MPLIFGAAVVSFFIVDLATSELPDPGSKPSISILNFLYACLQAIALAPLAIAMHRFVLLGEVASDYSFNLRDNRFKKFALAEVIYAAATMIPVMAISSPLTGWKAPLLALFALAVVIAVALHLLLIFPAIAINAAGATWANAISDVRGKALRLLATLFLVWLPTAPFELLLGRAIPDSHSLWRIASTLLASCEQAIFVAAVAAVASHFFKEYGQRLRQP